MNNITFSKEALEDFMYFAVQDKKIIKRINQLIKDIQRNGLNSGIGKPEPLKYGRHGTYSRRIDEENRLIYYLDELQNINILSCRGHYLD